MDTKTEDRTARLAMTDGQDGLMNEGAISRSHASDVAEASTFEPMLASRISTALSHAAVAAANEKRVTGGRGGLNSRGGNRGFAKLVQAIFVVFFIVPMIAVTLYLGLIASDQYVVETRFAVRAVSTPVGEIISSIGGSAAGTTKTETSIVAQYLKSESLVRNLDASIGLREIFSRPEADFISRFDPSGPIENLLSYWKFKVGISEGTSDGIISMSIAAFRPEDSLKISNAALDQATALVNSLSDRNRRNVLAVAEARLERTRARLGELTGQMAELRNKTGVLDSGIQGQAQLKLVSALELELAKLQATRASLGSLSSESVRLRALEPQIASLRQQIEREKAKLTGISSSKGKEALSNVMGDFDKMQVDQDIARKDFADAAAAYEDARINAERQQLYLSVFMKPMAPESSTYPKRFLMWAAAVAIAGLLTFILIAIARVVRDNRAA